MFGRRLPVLIVAVLVVPVLIAARWPSRFWLSRPWLSRPWSLVCVPALVVAALAVPALAVPVLAVRSAGGHGPGSRPCAAAPTVCRRSRPCRPSSVPAFAPVAAVALPSCVARLAGARRRRVGTRSALSAPRRSARSRRWSPSRVAAVPAGLVVAGPRLSCGCGATRSPRPVAERQNGVAAGVRRCGRPARLGRRAASVGAVGRGTAVAAPRGPPRPPSPAARPSRAGAALPGRDRGHQVALAHAGGAADPELAGEGLQIGQHHARQALARGPGPCGRGRWVTAEVSSDSVVSVTKILPVRPGCWPEIELSRIERRLPFRTQDGYGGVCDHLHLIATPRLEEPSLSDPAPPGRDVPAGGILQGGSGEGFLSPPPSISGSQTSYVAAGTAGDRLQQ